MNPYLRQREKEASARSDRNNQEHREVRRDRSYPASAVGAIENVCYFVETSTSGAHCFLCFRLGNLEGRTEKHKVRTGCSKCKKAFHPNCFTAYHHKGNLGEAGNAVLAQRLARINVGIDCNGRELRTTNKPVSGFPLLANLVIPHTPKVPLRHRRSRAEIDEDSGAAAAVINEPEPMEVQDPVEVQEPPRRQHRRRLRSLAEIQQALGIEQVDVQEPTRQRTRND